ncbi:hypothetical protein NPIL_511601 [Nephila pilipes]|uniref:Uncharacterized protein n=1 Tax=Nephila pilipes TaxID=299642 RepID=A0A8X6QK37_NEPPI|nr:hypothetical protein NPIL_511601 [Nephila pilipes]
MVLDSNEEPISCILLPPGTLVKPNPGFEVLLSRDPINDYFLLFEAFLMRAPDGVDVSTRIKIMPSRKSSMSNSGEGDSAS